MVRVAIIGAGAIGEVHIDSILRYPEQGVVVAVCDTDLEKAERVIAAKGLDAKGYESVTALLKECEVDAISICLPPNLHAPIAIEALEAGKHVIVEKPMAASLQECDAMIAAAEKADRILAVISQNRWQTPLVRAKRLIDEGLLGKVVHASINSLWWRGSNYYDLWWRGTWEQEAGGCLTSHSVHHIDLMIMLLGMPKQVQGFITNVSHDNSECEDIGFAVFIYDDMVVNFTSSLVSHGEQQSIVINGTDASITIPWHVSASTPRPNGFPDRNKALEKKIEERYQSYPALEVEGHPAQLLNFLRAIGQKEPVALDGASGRRTIELIHATYKSAIEGRVVDLPLGSDDELYTKAGMVDRMPKFHTKSKSVKGFSAGGITLGRDFNK
jgi:UDP-N-acetyl-2-amino-2-deoxyglucuronate dehydrogenase